LNQYFHKVLFYIVTVSGMVVGMTMTCVPMHYVTHPSLSTLSQHQLSLISPHIFLLF